MSRKRHFHPTGITLILAIMIMSAIVAIGITLTTVLVFQVRINKVVREGHQGYYAAESGIELGLNKLNRLKSGTLADALSGPNGVLLASLPAGADAEYVKYFCPNGTCPGTSLLTSSVQASSTASIPPIVEERQSIYIELYNVDSSLTQLASAPQLCVYAEGLDADGTGVADIADNEVLEISWVGWGTDLSLSRTQKLLVSHSKFSSATCAGSTITGSKGFYVPLTQFYPDFTPTSGLYAGFRIRITPLQLGTTTSAANGNVQNMQVFTSPSVNSQIQLKSVSDAAGQKQALVALFPWSLPLSSLFDFVIFSEKSITKSVPISIAQDLKRYGPYLTSGPSCVGNPVVCTIPATAFTDPNPDCDVSTPCSYYVRLIAPSATGWTASGAQVNTSGAGGTQSLSTLNATSCILRTPYIFTSTVNTITFTNMPANLTKYELLTRPAFSTADENYCP